MRFRLLPLLAVLALGAAHAQDDDPQAEEAQRLRQIEAERARMQELSDALRARAQAEEAELDRLKGQLVELAERLQADEAEMTAVEERLAQLDVEEREASAGLEAKQLALSDVLAALQSLERAHPPALAVSPDDANDAAMAASALSSVTPDLREQAAALRADLVRIERVRAEKAAQQRRLRQTEANRTERQRLLEQLVEDRQAARAEDAARLAEIEAEDRRLAREAQNLRELIEGIDRRQQRELPVAVSPLPGEPALYAALPDRFSDARQLVPLPAAGRIVSRFGASQPGGETSRDLAIQTRPGAVVTAPFRGRVAWAEPFGRLGNLVILDVGENFRLVLIGLGRLEVRRGEIVRAGEPLGTMPDGNPGLLRLQLRRANTPIDPEPWLRP